MRPSKPNLRPAKPSTKAKPTARRDGWTAQRVVRFLDVLAETGCVRDACRTVHLSSTSAYRRRGGDAQFAQDWDAALARAQTSLIATAYRHATQGVDQTIFRDGKIVEVRRKPDTATLHLLIKRGDLGAGRDPVTGQFTSASELDPLEQDEIVEKLRQRIDMIRKRRITKDAAAGICSHCHQPLLAPLAQMEVHVDDAAGAGEGIRTLDPDLGKVVLYP